MYFLLLSSSLLFSFFSLSLYFLFLVFTFHSSSSPYFLSCLRVFPNTFLVSPYLLLLPVFARSACLLCVGRKKERTKRQTLMRDYGRKKSLFKRLRSRFFEKSSLMFSLFPLVLLLSLFPSSFLLSSCFLFLSSLLLLFEICLFLRAGRSRRHTFCFH